MLFLGAATIGICCSLLKGGPTRYFLLDLHKSLGMTIFLLAIVRVIYRLRIELPAYPASVGRLTQPRVSSADQKADLERQLGRLAEFSSRERLTVIRSVSEIGSGLNGHRAKIMRLLSDPAVQTIVVEHRDRLARFGSESIEAALAACGRKLIVVDQTEMKDDLVQDMVDVLTSFCARLYGRRSQFCNQSEISGREFVGGCQPVGAIR